MGKVLQCVIVKLVKVQWSNDLKKESSWELEEDIKKNIYTFLIFKCAQFKGLHIFFKKGGCNTQRLKPYKHKFWIVS